MTAQISANSTNNYESKEQYQRNHNACSQTTLQSRNSKTSMKLKQKQTCKLDKRIEDPWPGGGGACL